MSYAPLNPEDAIILFADLQVGIVELAATTDAAQLRRAVGALAKLAKLFAVPVVATTAGSGGTPELIAEVAALGPLPLNTRTTTDAFLDAPTRAAILGAGRKTLIVCGVATEIVVQHSALSGVANGLNVQVAVDACGGLSARTEDAALRRMVEAGVVPTSLASLAGQWAGDFSQPKGGQALGVLFEMAGG